MTYTTKKNQAGTYTIHDAQARTHRRAFVSQAAAQAVAVRMTQGLVKFEEATHHTHKHGYDQTIYGRFKV